MKKPNKRRPDRTHYRAAGVSIVGPNKGARRYIVRRGKLTWRYVSGLGPHHGLRSEAVARADAARATEGTER